jgi:hypothetical protein
MKKILFAATLMIAVLFTAGTSKASAPMENGTVKFKFDNGKTFTVKTNSEGKFSYCCVDDDCDGFTIEVSSSSTSKLMKAKEKANRTKCANNLRMSGNKPSSEPTFTVCSKGGDCDDTADRCLVYVTFVDNSIQGMAITEQGIPNKTPPKKKAITE